MIYIYAKHIVFKEVAYLWYYALRDSGYSVKIVNHINPDITDLYLILGGHNIMLQIPENYIIIQLEQSINDLGEIHFHEKYLKLLHGAKEIFDYSMKNVENLQQSFHLKSHYVPLGYHELLHNTMPFNLTHKPIDILFFGSITPRRHRILEALQLRKKLQIVIRTDLWGTERDQLVAKSKIVLNIHCFEQGILEMPRINYLLHQGAFVISEMGCEPEISQLWKNKMVLADYHNLVYTCVKYLKNPSARKQMSFTGQQYLSSQPFTENLQSILPLFPEKDTIKVKKKARKPKFFIPSNIGEVETCFSLEQQYILKLPQIPDDKLPYVSIVTPTGNRRHLFTLAIRNFMSFTYPAHKLEWIIVDDGTQEIQDLIPKDSRIKYYQIPLKYRMALGKKRNYCVEKCSHKVILHMDDDDFYTPENILARVKCLLKYRTKGIECVGCSEVGTYELINGLSSIGSNGKRFLTESSLCYYKHFWKNRPFNHQDTSGEYKYFLEYRQHKCKTIPFQFITLALTHGYNTTENLRMGKGDNKQDLTDYLEAEDQFYLLNLRKVILKKLKLEKNKYQYINA